MPWVMGILAVGGVALFGALLYLSGPARVLTYLSAVGLEGFLAVVGSLLLSLITWSLSWYTLLRGARILLPWHRLVSPILAGFTVTYLTPSMYLGGEPVRAYWVARDCGVSMARVMATAIVERILAGIALLCFASIGGVFALTLPGISLADKYALALGLGGMAVLLFLGMIGLAWKAHWLSGLLRWLARAFPKGGWFARAAAKVAEAEREIQRAFTVHLGHTALAFLFQLLTVFINYMRPQLFFYFTERALFTFPQLSLYFTLSAFVNAFLWITPGGFGLTDGGRVGVFTLLGISPSGGVAFNVVYRFAELLVLGVGLLVMLRRGLVRLRRGRVEIPVEDPGQHR